MEFKPSIKRSICVFSIVIVILVLSIYNLYTNILGEISYSYLNFLLFTPIGILSVFEIIKAKKLKK